MIFLPFYYLYAVCDDDAQKERWRIFAKTAHSVFVNLVTACVASQVVPTAGIVENTTLKCMLGFTTLYYAIDTYIAAKLPQKDWPSILHHLIALFGCFVAFYLWRDAATVQFGFTMFGILDASSTFAMPMRLRLLERDTKSGEYHHKLNNALLSRHLNTPICTVLFTVPFFVARFIFWPRYLWSAAPANFPQKIWFLIFSPLFAINTFWMKKLVCGIWQATTKKKIT